MISIMSVADTPEGRLAEIRGCADMIRKWMEWHRFRDFGIQVNMSCPNCGHDPAELAKEILPTLDELRGLGVPIIPKFGPDFTVEMALRVQRHPAVSAICIFNTLPWDQMPEAERLHYFGTTESPLVRHLGEKSKGGISGAPLLPRLKDWLGKARGARLALPVIAGGGILCPEDARSVIRLGAAGISLASIAFLKPFDVCGTAHAARQMYKGLS
jgi:dihydroorotate dehydrogenase